MNRLTIALLAAGMIGPPGLSTATRAVAQSGDIRPALAGAPAEELAGIRRALEQLVSSFDASREYRQAELVLRRIELRERRIAPLRNRLASTKEEQENLTLELEQMQSMRREFQDQAREATDPETEQVNRRMLADLDPAIAALVTRQDMTYRRGLDLESELSQSLDEISLLDERLDELIRSIEKRERK